MTLNQKISYTNLSLVEKIIQSNYYTGRSMQFIAIKFDRSKSPIHYELRNNGKLKTR